MTDTTPPSDPNVVWVADPSRFAGLSVAFSNAADATAEAKRRFVLRESGAGDSFGDAQASRQYDDVYVRTCSLLDQLHMTFETLSDRLWRTGLVYTDVDTGVARTMGPR